jgi:hypothetical protein
MEDDRTPGESSTPRLQTAVARLIASGYDLSVDVLDAVRVSEWQGSNDDLMRWLEERHQFTAGTAARYLRDLHVGLRSGPELP